MRKHYQKTIYILISIIPIIFLSACWDIDEEMAEIAFQSWAEQNGLYKDGNYKPEGVVAKAVENAIGDFTNREEFVQIDGLDVIRDIEHADNLAAEALAEYDKGKMTSAVSLRPDDWRLHEQAGVLWMAEYGNSAATASYFGESDELIWKQLMYGGDCYKLRRTQLEVRLGTLWEAVKNYEIQYPGETAATLRAAHKVVQEELQEMNKGYSVFCEE